MAYTFTRTGAQIEEIHNTVDNIYNTLGNTNLLSNHNFLIQTPDDSQPLPSATPTSYPPGYQIFSGVFANETTGITNLTYIDGRVSFSGGDLYFSVSNSGGLERLTEFAASVADFDGKPRQLPSGSWSLVGDNYRVTVGVADLAGGPLGSVKFEQGSVATGHEVVEPLTVQAVGGLTNYQAASVADMIAGKPVGWQSGDAVIAHVTGQTWSSGGTKWEYIGTSLGTIADFRQMSAMLYAADFGIVVNSSDPSVRIANREALKAAHDAAAMGSKIWLPIGGIQCSVESGQNAILTITRNVSFTSSGSRASRVLGYGEADSVIDIRITENDGLLDVRGWEFSEIGVQNVDGKDALRFLEGGMAIISSEIKKSSFKEGPLDTSDTQHNYAINMMHPIVSHSSVELCTLGPCYLYCGDAVRFVKNLSVAEVGIAYALNTDLGVYNITFDSNTIVNRDGALHIIDADAVRFTNNQCEQFQSYGPNRSPISTMIRIEGRSRKVRSCVVHSNNLGGGTNVDYLLHISNADTVDIECNKLVPVNVAEIHCASNTERIRFGMMNRQDNSILNPRPDKLWRTRFENLSLSNVNMPMDFSPYLQGGWSFPAGTSKHAYIDDTGALHFIEPVNGGAFTQNSNILEFPGGPNSINPKNTLTCDWVSGAESHFSGGGSYAEIQFLGGGTVIRVKDFKANSPCILPSFQLDKNVAIIGV